MSKPRRIRLRDEDEADPHVSATRSQSTAESLDSRHDFFLECKACFRIGGPIALANLLDRIALWITWAVVGQHGGAEELGPASLASTVNNVLGTSVNIGLSLAVQTLASQSLGVGDMRAFNRVLQRALPVSVVFSIPVITLLLLLGPLLRALGRPGAVADSAHDFALTILPVTPFTGMQRCMTAWLAALQITRPVVVINLFLLPFHALLSVGLVYYTPLGYLGAGVSTSVQVVVRGGLTYGYIRYSPKTREAWPDGFQLREAFSGWWSYLQIALPGVLFLAEFWVGELLVFLAALLPHPTVGLSAFAIYQLINATCYQPPGGLRVAVSSRVGKALGGGEPAHADRTFRSGVALVLIWIIVPTATLLGAPESIARLFTSDERVVRLLGVMSPVLVLYVGLDALLAIGAGALTGCGRQGLGGRLALISYAHALPPPTPQPNPSSHLAALARRSRSRPRRPTSQLRGRGTTDRASPGLRYVTWHCWPCHRSHPGEAGDDCVRDRCRRAHRLAQGERRRDQAREERAGGAHRG